MPVPLAPYPTPPAPYTPPAANGYGFGIKIHRCSKPTCVFRLSKFIALSSWSNLCVLCCLQCSNGSAASRHRNGAVGLRRLSYLINVHPRSNKRSMFVLSYCQSGLGRMLLMYQYGARSVKCAVCNFVTSVGVSSQAQLVLLNRSSTAETILDPKSNIRSNKFAFAHYKYLPPRLRPIGKWRKLLLLALH
ncbi:hypothetical protein CXB51_032865 [Gossypium anomalum]|uniref:Zinc finger LSD1-type domain-containing protein n=1 Tax=Gossypium anomalum TaxID=47600 RepID=A0A8J5XTI3_9ROSI|nr:hypothetical protein CXB51_032865 [Gossypium anomalum]